MVVAEVCYMLNERGGSDVEAKFLDSLARREVRLLELDPEDIANIAALVRSLAGFRWVEQMRGLLWQPTVMKPEELPPLIGGTSHHSHPKTVATMNSCQPRSRALSFPKVSQFAANTEVAWRWRNCITAGNSAYSPSLARANKHNKYLVMTRSLVRFPQAAPLSCVATSFPVAYPNRGFDHAKHEQG